MPLHYVQYENVVPLIAPQDITTTATASAWVAFKGAHELVFLLSFGNIASTSADQSVTVTVEAATAAASSGETALTFKYRLSGAIGANTWGTITSSAATGLSVATTDDNKMLAIELNPAQVQTELADASHVRVIVTPDAGATNVLVSACAVLQPRYKQATMVSAT